MGLPRKFNTWRKRGGVWKRLLHSWLPRLSRNQGAATGAVTLWWQAYLPFSARTVKTILPVWPRFPTRCGTDGFIHFTICCSNRLGWYWGRQRTSWIRKTVTVFRWRKSFVREIFAVSDNRENFLTAKISRYTVRSTLTLSLIAWLKYRTSSGMDYRMNYGIFVYSRQLLTSLRHQKSLLLLQVRL